MPGGFGLPTMGAVPTNALAAMFPWVTYPQDQALKLLQQQNALNQANIAANASMFGDTTRAQATLGAAQIGAGATIDAQQIQTKGMLQALQAQINADAIRYRNGDIAAGQRLQASLRQQAELKNTDTALTLAKMMGSGQLRESIGARLALRGMGQMPGVSSALGGLENRIWADTNRTVDMPPEYAPVKVGMDVGGGGGGGGGGVNLSGMNFGGSFGGGAGANSNLGGQYTDLLKTIRDSMNTGDLFGFSAPSNVANMVPPARPPEGPPIVGGRPTGDITMLPTDPNYAKTIADLNAYFGIPNRAARGGNFKGQTALITGDSPSGKPTGYEELVLGENVKVIPLHRAAFGYDSNIRSEVIDDPRRGNPNIYDPKFIYDPRRRPDVGYDPSVTDPNWDRNKLADAAKTAAARADAISQGSRTAIANQRSYQNDIPAPVYGSGNEPTPTAEQRQRRSGNRQPMSNLPSKKFGTPPPAAGPASPPAATVTTQPVGGVQIMPQAPLADINNIPALQQIRTGNVMPAFGDMPALAEPGLGITSTPAPYTRSATFNAMSPAEQEDALQMWEFLGVPRQVALYQMAQATPGFSMSPTRAFGF